MARNKVEEGIARGIFLCVFEDQISILNDSTDATLHHMGVRHPGMLRAEITKIRDDAREYGLDGYDDNVSIPTPAWAFVPADELYEQVELLNHEPMMAIVSKAEIADRRRMAIDTMIVVPPEISEDEYLFSFGLAIGKMATGTDPGEAWFDEHADFDLKLPRDFDFYEDFDGELGLKYGPEASAKKPPKRRRGASARRAR